MSQFQVDSPVFLIDSWKCKRCFCNIHREGTLKILWKLENSLTPPVIEAKSAVGRGHSSVQRPVAADKKWTFKYISGPRLHWRVCCIVVAAQQWHSFYWVVSLWHWQTLCQFRYSNKFVKYDLGNFLCLGSESLLPGLCKLLVHLYLSIHK